MRITQETITSRAAAYGLAVYSTNRHNPGRRYQFGLEGKTGGFKELSANLTGKEAAIWLDAYREGIDRMAREQEGEYLEHGNA